MKGLNNMQFSNRMTNIKNKIKITNKITSYYPRKMISNKKSINRWNMVSLYRDPNLPRGGCGSCRGAM